MEVYKKAIVVVSFGTSYVESLNKAIGNISDAIGAEFPEYFVLDAFTSTMVLKRLKEQQIFVDTVESALKKLIDMGIEEVIIQPTHIMDGFEYEKILSLASPYEAQFKRMKIGTPLLFYKEDFTNLGAFLIESNLCGQYPRTAFVYMGHGTEHPANVAYERLADTIHEMGHKNIFIGTVEATPDIEDILMNVKAFNPEEVVLIPLMIVAGDHANNDMAGSGEDSWESRFSAMGLPVRSYLKGLGEYGEIAGFFIEHIYDAL